MALTLESSLIFLKAWYLTLQSLDGSKKKSDHYFSLNQNLNSFPFRSD